MAGIGAAFRQPKDRRNLHPGSKHQRPGGKSHASQPALVPPACPSRDNADAWRQWLLSHAADRPNAQFLASMLASQQCGRGAMPDWLGLGAAEFSALVGEHFPAFPISALQQTGRRVDPSRDDELEELVRLLLKDSERPNRAQRWLAVILATGCMGSDHLWQDLGLWNRAELSDLMEQNFPAVAQRNTADMKWKRFLYKQLCETEGIYTCRSPSCEVCVDYHACFGPEN
jgi:nitrogen fixation protein NifQ